jgi:hypothetical protein
MTAMNLDESVKAFALLVDSDPVTIFRILNVRTIMDQRGYDSASLARVMGRSPGWVLSNVSYVRILALQATRKDPERFWSNINDRLDEIEHAITIDTQRLGGVYAVTGATTDYVDDFTEIMSSARALQTYNDQED